MSFSSDLLSARSAAGVGVDVEGTSGAVPVATLWIGAGGGGGTLTPAAADKPGDRDIGGEDGKLERGNSGLSPKPVMDTPDNPSDETLCGAAFHEYGRRVGMVPRSSLKEGKKRQMVEKGTKTPKTNPKPNTQARRPTPPSCSLPYTLGETCETETSDN